MTEEPGSLLDTAGLEESPPKRPSVFKPAGFGSSILAYRQLMLRE